MISLEPRLPDTTPEVVLPAPLVTADLTTFVSGERENKEMNKFQFSSIRITFGKDKFVRQQKNLRVSSLSVCVLENMMRTDTDLFHGVSQCCWVFNDVSEKQSD